MTFLPVNLDVDQIVRDFNANGTPEETRESEDVGVAEVPADGSVAMEELRSRVVSEGNLEGLVACDDGPNNTTSASEAEEGPRGFPIFGNFTMEKIIESIDGSGSYQRMLVMCSMLCMFGSSFVSFCISFLAAEPLFRCEKADSPGNFVSCSEHVACQDSAPNVYFRFNSWTESMQMYCDQKFVRESGKVLCLLVNSLTCFFFLNLSDVYGRKRIIMVNSTIVILALLLAYLLQEYHLKMMFVGLAFGCEGCFSSLYLFLINEVSSTSSKPNSPNQDRNC